MEYSFSSFVLLYGFASRRVVIVPETPEVCPKVYNSVTAGVGSKCPLWKFSIESCHGF